MEVQLEPNDVERKDLDSFIKEIVVDPLDLVPDTWAPPTSENIYDPCHEFSYEPPVMHESRLPLVFIRNEPKRQHTDPIVSASTTTLKPKVQKDDMVNIPRSLFDRPSAAILKMRREVKLQKVKGLMVGGSCSAGFAGLPPLVVNRPTPDITLDESEWLINEDYSILQVIQDLQGLPLSLTILMPGHTPNWHLVADAVNEVSRIHRSSRDCKEHFENFIMLHEDAKNNRPMKPSHLYQQENNDAFTGVFLKRCKIVMELAQKRKEYRVPRSADNVEVQTQEAETVKYEKLLTPMDIANNQKERIQMERQNNQPAGINETNIAGDSFISFEHLNGVEGEELSYYPLLSREAGGLALASVQDLYSKPVINSETALSYNYSRSSRKPTTLQEILNFARCH